MNFRHRGHRQGRGHFQGSRSFQSRSSPALPSPASTQRKIEDIAVAQSGQEDGKSEGAAPTIKNVEFLASYNWLDRPDRRTPTILVPGKPPKWLPPAQPQKLHEDGGIYYRDQNGARFPNYPSEPAIQAILHSNPGHDFSGIDIFGCGSTIGGLLHFAKSESRTFRFGVERVGSTVFLIRKTNSPRETIEEVRGYGHTFPDAYTTWEHEVRGSASHQRIVTYDFAGLKCMIRTETDGYLANKLPVSSKDAVASSDDIEHGGVSLDHSLSSLSFGPSAPTVDGPLTIEEAGHVIPQQAIFDLKTRSIKQKDNMEELIQQVYPKLWVSQTPNFVIAYHKGGEFKKSDIHIKDVRDEVKNWESQNADILARLAWLFRKLSEVSKVEGQARFEVRRVEGGPLEIWSEVPGWSALPVELKTKWTGDKDHAATAVHEQENASDDDEDDAELLKF